MFLSIRFQSKNNLISIQKNELLVITIDFEIFSIRKKYFFSFLVTETLDDFFRDKPVPRLLAQTQFEIKN